MLVMVSHTRRDPWSWPAIANSWISRSSINPMILWDCLAGVSSSWLLILSLVQNPNISGAITLYHWATSPGTIFLRSQELVGVPWTRRIGVPSRSQRSRYLIFCPSKLKVSKYHICDSRSVILYSDLLVSRVVPTIDSFEERLWVVS